MKKVLSILSLALVVGLALPIATPAPVLAAPVSVDLVAGQHINIGNVTVWNDADKLYVQFNTTAAMVETHVAVAESYEALPRAGNGNPRLRDFYSVPNPPDPYHYTYKIDLAWDVGTRLYIAAHATANDPCYPLDETAWACGQSYGGRNWAMYFTYVVQ